MLKNTIWPAIQEMVGHRDFQWSQDGTTCHTKQATHFSAVNLGETLFLTKLRSPGQAESLISISWIISFGAMQAKKLFVSIHRVLKKSKILRRMLQLHWKKMSSTLQ